MLSTLAKKQTLLAKTQLVEASATEKWPSAGANPPLAGHHMENQMKRLITLAMAAYIAEPAAVAAQQVASMALTCDTGTAAADAEAPNLHGHWDFLMVPRGTPSFGLMSIGFVGAEYGGSLAPARTAPVVLRNINVSGNSLQMVVASREGDVRFDGKLSAKGDLMCGTVTYHGGETFPMIAQRRPSTYQSQPQSQRAR